MKKKFIIIVLVQVLLLVGIIAFKQYWIWSGQKILLKCLPVDPWDVFRGRYVRLTYDIGSIKIDSPSEVNLYKRNEKIYVALTKSSNGIYEMASYGRTEPHGKLFILGRIPYDTYITTITDITIKDDKRDIRKIPQQSYNKYKQGDKIVYCVSEKDFIFSIYPAEIASHFTCPAYARIANGEIDQINETKFIELRIEYGIESYFVEEGMARQIESPRRKELLVEASLHPNGKALITALFLNGHKIR